MKVVQSDALLLIPDISGFTKFVNNNDIKHSSHVISELLEAIIDQNTLGLQVAGIEGDAIMFYRVGPCPGLDEVISQCKKMFLAFHQHLNNYKLGKFCHCGASISDLDLSLKFVVHYGNLVINIIHNYLHVIGPDVILTHRLLKNNINSKEYILISNSLLDDSLANNFIHDGITFNPGATDYNGHGVLYYNYGRLTVPHTQNDSLHNKVDAVGLSAAC